MGYEATERTLQIEWWRDKVKKNTLQIKNLARGWICCKDEGLWFTNQITKNTQQVMRKEKRGNSH